jgi:hypothetical protein
MIYPFSLSLSPYMFYMFYLSYMFYVSRYDGRETDERPRRGSYVSSTAATHHGTDHHGRRQRTASTTTDGFDGMDDHGRHGHLRPVSCRRAPRPDTCSLALCVVFFSLLSLPLFSSSSAAERRRNKEKKRKEKKRILFSENGKRWPAVWRRRRRRWRSPIDLPPLAYSSPPNK